MSNVCRRVIAKNIHGEWYEQRCLEHLQCCSEREALRQDGVHLPEQLISCSQHSLPLTLGQLQGILHMKGLVIGPQECRRPGLVMTPSWTSLKEPASLDLMSCYAAIQEQLSL